uniref:C3H1-type domain-containing protein n=1 Tax=Scleropages formosus TaxID=113540 RepID=A0A8C9TKE6_SCLFO
PSDNSRPRRSATEIAGSERTKLGARPALRSRVRIAGNGDAERPNDPARPSPDTAVIVAKTALRVCPSLEEDCDSCSDLHLCRYFVNGGCKYKNKCKHTHDLDSYHNTVLLKRDGLLDLDKVELFQLLLQNDTSLLPNICSYYNAGKGVHGSCNFKNECKKLHICKHFFQDSCKFGATCTRSHTFDDRAKEILKGWGLSAENQLILQKIYRNRFIISRSDICLFFLQGKCRFDATCRSVHCPLPYKWEKLDSNGMTWKDVPNEEDVEMAYCNPENDSSTESPPVNFLTMMCESAKVRRLSTPSSVKMLSPFPLATEWIWYRKNDNGRWIELETEVESSFLSFLLRRVTYGTLSRVCAAVLDMYLRSDEDEAKVALRRRPRRRN